MTGHSSNPSLEFVAAPALAPAEVQVDPELMRKYQEELAQVSISRRDHLEIFLIIFVS